MTLACEDGHQVEANKVVLVALNHFFMKTLKLSKHPHHRLIYMRGDRFDKLITVVDYFYGGGG